MLYVFLFVNSSLRIESRFYELTVFTMFITPNKEDTQSMFLLSVTADISRLFYTLNALQLPIRMAPIPLTHKKFQH